MSMSRLFAVNLILPRIGGIKKHKSEIINVAIIWGNSLHENSEKTVILVSDSALNMATNAKLCQG